MRILGPALGFIVGSLCTSVYADLSVDPKIDTTDPRWVGAWWLGEVLKKGKKRFIQRIGCFRACFNLRIVNVGIVCHVCFSEAINQCQPDTQASFAWTEAPQH